MEHMDLECISSISYSLMVNDEPNGFSMPTHGIREGAPLSPYIFILCMEVPIDFSLKLLRTHRQ